MKIHALIFKACNDDGHMDCVYHRTPPPPPLKIPEAFIELEFGIMTIIVLYG